MQKVNTKLQSHSEICDLHVRALPRTEICLSWLMQSQTDMKSWNPARCGSLTKLLSQFSTVQTQFSLLPEGSSFSLPTNVN